MVDMSRFQSIIQELAQQQHFFFNFQALASIKKLTQHIVRVSKNYNYQLLENGDIDWYPHWTFPNSLLFTMTTLTLIGK